MSATLLLDPSVNTGPGASAAPTVIDVARARTTGRAPSIPGFGPYLTRLMDARGLSNVELARLAGISESVLSKWKSGVDGPSAESLRRVAPHLGVRYGDLLVQAKLATPEELGTAGAPPPPGPPLPTQIRAIMADMINPRVSSRDKEILMKVIARAHQMWREMREVPREPQMRRR